MKIAFCTTCKGRVQHIERTLPQNIADTASYPDAVFVVLDYNSQDHLQEYLTTVHGEDIAAGRLVVYSFPDAAQFHMAHAKNMAHRLGMMEGAQVLVNLDADNYTGPGFAQHIRAELAEDANAFLWARMVKDGDGRLPKGISGRIAVTTAQFLKAGGYDEKFNTWSPDDKDFQHRLRRLGFTPREIAPEYLRAILHNDKLRFREYPHAKTDQTEEQFHQEIYESDKTIANFGHIGIGNVYRNYRTPVQIGPVPTRIFGIGMHKTATTSLAEALRVLGFDAAHWKSAHWAKAIYTEILLDRRSPTLEKSYALCDLPIPILFRELDTCYPGSKFILTLRDEEQWLRSVRNHWDHERNPYRATWNTDPFSHKIHKAIYGQKGFDEAIFRARYRRHNAEVREYFADRPQDLLIMHMDRQPGWTGLCRFLNRPTPAAPYPEAFATRNHGEIRA
jgi:hypothetical protein